MPATLLKKEFGSRLGVHLVTSFEEFRFYWGICSYLKRLARLTPELQDYCDQEVLDRILYEDNEYVSIVLRESLQRIVSYLKEKDKRFRIGTYLHKDTDQPQWEEFTILINVNYKDFNEKLSLWRDIEKAVTEILEKYKQQTPEHFGKIEKANEIISTTIHKFTE